MISAAALSAMQATATAAMDESITVKRATSASDGAGGHSETWAATATSPLVGNLAQPTGTMLQNYDYLVGSLSAWQVRVPAGSDVKENDQLIVGGLTLRVQVILQPQSYQTSMRLLATEVQ